jgi:MarR family transcriptional regulator, organic hydroperoxide resistance regulator
MVVLQLRHEDSMAAFKTKTTPGRPRRSARFVPPATITLPQMLVSGADLSFRETLYLMFLAFGRLTSFREAFGKHLSLTASQFIVLIGTAYRQGSEGVSIRTLSDHTQLAATHVTTEVGRLIGKGLLTKTANERDRRGVLVRLSPKGETAILEINPLLRRVNDRLFQGVSRDDFATVARFLTSFALNSEYALAELRRSERERETRDRWPRSENG